MVKFGRKFFFDKVHTKKTHTLPIIITIILVVAIIATFAITSYFKKDKDEEKIKEPKAVLVENIEIEIFSELPKISTYFKKLENIKAEDFSLTYPEDLIITEDTSECDAENITDNCKKQYAASLGEYKVILQSEKLKLKNNEVMLQVVDKTAPELKLKEVSITEGDTYSIENFIETCNDNSKSSCIYEYYSADTDEEGNPIDYNNFTAPGTYTIKIIAKDASENKSEAIETKLVINEKPQVNNNNKNETEKPKTCEYGDLKYSKSYVVAMKVDNTECAISVEEADSLTNQAAIRFNKMLVKEIQSAYLKNTIEKLQLGGEMTYDITYGKVFNTSNKGVVGYFLMSEAKQTINGKTTTLARYYIDENGNRVWKVNALNLK